METPTPAPALSKARIRRMKREMPLPQRLRWARKQAGLSLDRLGQMVGTSRQHLIRLEKGQHKPRPDMVVRIAQATEQPVELFVDEDEEGEPPVQLRVPMVVALDYDLLAEAITRSQRKDGEA